MSKDGLLEKVISYDESHYINQVRKAMLFAEAAHSHQKRASGEPYFTHPLAVATIVADLKLDSLAVIVALLHDTVEDTDVTLKQISKEFGEEVAELVNGVTKINFIEKKSESVVQAENLRKLIIAISKDIRILLVKLADRLHNMRTLHYIKSSKKRARIATETLEIFAPLAERIGVHNVKNELQDLAFKTLYPDIRDSIIKRIKLLKSNDNHKLPKKIITTLIQLFKTHGIEAKILDREKTPYSIWMKMKRKKISFEQLSDIMAFRIIVKDLLECYKVLGIIHNHYHTIPKSFKDYISTPKQNGYQSLHTLIMGPEQQQIEVQIRTEKIHKSAEWGITAHWSYKQKVVLNEKYNTWIQELLKIVESSTDSTELLNNAKLEMYYDQVFCFTPKGRVIALPTGASAIDFAYAIHSDVGDKCVGVKINRKIAPLRTKLKNGDQVEIITDKNHVPLPSWEKFAVTAKALSHIKRTIRDKKKQEYINLGRVMLSHILTHNKISFSEELLSNAVEFFHKENLNSLLQSIGEGHISTTAVLKSIAGELKKSDSYTKSPLDFNLKNLTATKDKIPIKGLSADVSVHFADCCHPIPGDPIVGIHQTGKGVIVHIADCETLQNYSSYPEKWLEIAWDKNNKRNIYSATIKAVMLNKPGSLAILSIEISKHSANISNFRIISRATDFFDIAVDLEVKGLTHLMTIMESLQSKPCIHSVQRHIKA
ncbi:MAG: bifunctional (p)ppGpp synthetase/guanosine-3',5'-bis(diphosphate) 3'-pyrophosphohydrolase [Alphaproteobacteria bacterium]|nr:bifunctional (p)ppGpp synthetase/guanosine-3',5'-bis(diphosphate) 3'-pyrophosphohydrolase [Alphaproteobacteria bacterium]